MSELRLFTAIVDGNTRIGQLDHDGNFHYGVMSAGEMWANHQHADDLADLAPVEIHEVGTGVWLEGVIADAVVIEGDETKRLHFFLAKSYELLQDGGLDSLFNSELLAFCKRLFPNGLLSQLSTPAEHSSHA